MPTYAYTSSIDFIDNLDFDYLETYSFQRGQEFEEKRIAWTNEFKELTHWEKKKSGLSELEEARFNELMNEVNSQQKLIVENGLFHITCQKMSTFKYTDEVIDRLKAILRTEIVDIPGWLCSPLYRDAIVFYNNKHEIVSALNVCLGCEYMQTGSFHFINADAKTYNLLFDFFKELGHEVEHKYKS